MGRLLAVGLNLMDLYVEDGVMYPGGNELNVAVYARRLGHEADFMGVFGDDETVPLIRGILKKEGVGTGHCRMEKGENGLSYVSLRHGERVFLGHNHGGVTGSRPVRILPEDEAYIKSFDVVSSSLYGRIPEEELLKLCRMGIPVSFDFSDSRNPELVKRLAPHFAYAFFSCADYTEEETLQFLEGVKAAGGGICIATRGAGRTILFDGKNRLFQEAEKTRIVDTMGAGDSFIAAFLLSHQQETGAGTGQPEALKKALRAGAAFAAETCRREGAIGYQLPIPSGMERSC